MKKITLLLLFISSVCFGQGMSFKCGGYSFTVYEDETPLEYSFMAGDDIGYDAWGRVDEIGNIDIGYDAWGRIDEIGGMDLNYDAWGRYSGSSGSIGCRW